MDWPGHKRQRSTLRLYRNNRNGTFTDVTRAAGLDVELYGMGVAVGDFNNDGFPDLLVTCVGQNRLFRNTGKGTFVDVTRASGLDGRTAFSTSALWFDFDRDGLLDLFVCNYVKWSAEHDVFCSLDGKQKSYCTPEAYRGETCWLFRNRGNGTFEDVTATSGIFDSSSKSLGVALLDDDQDGWPDLFVANDTQPNKLYRNQRNGTFKDVGARGRRRAQRGRQGARRHGRRRRRLRQLRPAGRGRHQLRQRDDRALSRRTDAGLYEDVAMRAGRRRRRRATGSGSAACSPTSISTARLDLVVANGHIDETVRNIRGNVGYAQPPQLFLNQGNGTFRDVAAAAGGEFAQPRVGRGLACGDFDRDGDVDLLMTTNNGPAVLFRNDQLAGQPQPAVPAGRARKSNRDAIGALVRVFHGGTSQSRMVKSGSSYLSQSELPRDVRRRPARPRRPRGRSTGRAAGPRSSRMWSTGKAYECVEGKGIGQGS